MNMIFNGTIYPFLHKIFTAGYLWQTKFCLFCHFKPLLLQTFFRTSCYYACQTWNSKIVYQAIAKTRSCKIRIQRNGEIFKAVGAD